MHRLASSLALVGPCAALLVGCASGADAWRKDVSELKREIHTLRSENVALGQRVEALEASAARAPMAPAGSARLAEGGPTADRPRLEVVRLSPEARPNDGWVAIDPSDPARTRAAVPVADAPATEIRSEKGGAVVQRPAAPATPPPPPRK